MFGYNFARGYINRDRERLTSPMEEATMLAKIWEQPILDGREEVIRRYLGLFRDHENRPDIAFAEKVVSEAVAGTLWDSMRKGSPSAFFYSEQADDCEPDGADQVCTSYAPA